MMLANLVPQAAPGLVCEQLKLPDGAVVPDSAAVSAGRPPCMCRPLRAHIAAQRPLPDHPAGCQPAGAGEGHLPALPGLRHSQLPLLQGGQA